MNLTKNQIYIISAVIIAVIVYFMFFKKKKVTIVSSPAAKPGESGYFGEDWGWGTGPQAISRAEAIYSMSGPAGNSVAGTMESGFNPATGLVENGRQNNPWPTNAISQKTGLAGKVYNSPNAANPSMNNPWPTSSRMETGFAGSWLK